MSSLTDEERRALRRALRARRRAITGPDREIAARRVARLADGAGLLRPGRRIGLYLDMAEELPTRPLIDRARSRGCIIFLPRILSVRHSRMAFFEAGTRMRVGPFGILESAGGRRAKARDMDVVFLPLVGFDARGERMGMGRGFYDRFFAHRRRLHVWRRPLLIGVAYSVQQVDALPVAAHDVRLDGIVTECSMHWFLKGESR